MERMNPEPTEMPRELSIADAKAEHAQDEKFRRLAEAKRARDTRTAPERLGDLTTRILGMTGIARESEEYREPIRDAATVISAPPREIPPDVVPEIVPKRFTLASFANYEPANPTQTIALRVAKRWVECARAGDGKMLALIGATGTGKSHLLYAAVNALLGTHYPAGCYSRPWYKLADELRYGGKSPFSPTRALCEAFEVRAILWDQRIVMLDEVRPTASTAFDDTELAKFSCHAYDAKLSVFITTNVSPLADVMGAPAASRFTQVVVEGPDRRQAV